MVGSRILLFDTVDSTNIRAFNVEGDGTVVVAESQTSGRGRHGRYWESPGGVGVWFSVRLEGLVEGLPFAVPLSVRDGLLALEGFPKGDGAPVVKWPNDVLLQGKKCCGVLIEHRGGVTVVGIGVNVLHRLDDFPPGLRDTATSLRIATGRDWERRVVLRGILEAFDKRVMALRKGLGVEIRQEWAKACAVEGAAVQVDETNGVVTGLDESGALLVRVSGGSMRVPWGDRVKLAVR